jgi:hypothetical protein
VAPVGAVVALWLAAGLEAALALLLCVPVDVAVDVAVAEYMAGAVLDEVLVHPETVAETRTAAMTQLTAASLAPLAVPEVVMRTFMKPPYMPGGERSYR